MELAKLSIVHNTVLSRRPAMTLNLRQIEVFRAVMTAGSISGAAQLLFVSQPAVSRLLSHTELRVGFPLFERTRGRLYATPEAKKLFREIESVYSAVQRVNEMAADLSKNRSGILNVVCSPSVGQMLVPHALARFREVHPGVKVTFQCLGFAPLRDRLLLRQAELGIVMTPLDHPHLEVTALCRNRLVCILPAGHALSAHAVVTPADLAPYPLVGYERESPFGRLVGELFERHAEPLSVAIEVGSPQNALPLVHLGAGVGLVDELSARSWVGHGGIVARPVADAPVLQASLVHVRAEPLSRLTQAFIAQLRILVREQGYAVDAPMEPCEPITQR